MKNIISVRTCFMIVGLCSIVDSNLLGGLLGTVGTLLGNGETYSKCPGVIPNRIGNCVPIFLYKRPCVGVTRSGKLLPPCLGDADDRNDSGSNKNTNTNQNVNNITNTIVIKITNENSVEVEKPADNQ